MSNATATQSAAAALIAARSKLSPNANPTAQGYTLTSPLPTMTARDAMPVRVRNHGDLDEVWKYDGQRYLIAAHSEALVPYNAMVLYMGDPEARDLNADIRPRFDAYRRLLSKYGVHEHSELWATKTAKCACAKTSDSWVDTSACSGHLPAITAHALDTGEQYMTVLDDPQGSTLNLAPRGESNEIDEMKRLVALQAQQIASLEGVVRALDSGAQAIEDSAAEVPTKGGAKAKAATQVTTDTA